MDYKDSRFFISQNKHNFYDCYDLTEDVFSCNEICDVRLAIWKKTPLSIFEETKELEKWVVKTFRKILTFNWEKVIQELKILVWVDHPNCVRLIEWFEDDYHMFAVFYREGKG